MAAPGPSTPRSRTPRSRRPWRAALLLATVAVAAGTAYGVRAVTGPDCTVRLDDGSRVALTRQEAMRATALAADTSQVRRAERRTRRVVAAVTSGRPVLSCAGSRPQVRPQTEGRSGLTPRAERVLDEMRHTFGDLPVGGFAPGGVSSGHMEGSAHYDGRAVDVFFRPATRENKVRGWALAQWAVAHAEGLRVATVIYDGRIWSSRWPLDRWRPYRPPGSGGDDPVLMHRDHVHIDVLA